MKKHTKNLKDKFNIAKDALHKIATQASIWEPVSKIGTLRYVANMALKQIGEIDNNWHPLEKSKTNFGKSAGNTQLSQGKNCKGV